MVILYTILRPDLRKLSIVRALNAFVLFCGITIIQNKEAWSDRPGYAYIPGEFAISTSEVLAIWLVVVLVSTLLMRLTRQRAFHNAA